jgi:hypothetical protein
MLDRIRDQLRVSHLTVADSAFWERYLAEALKRRGPLAEREFGRSHTGRADVETNRISCHWLVLPYLRAALEQLSSSGCLSKDGSVEKALGLSATEAWITPVGPQPCVSG